MLIKRIALWLTCLATSVFVAQASCSPASSDEAQVRQVVEDYFEALNAGDASRIVALFAEDGEVLPPGAPTAVGRKALQATYDYVVASTDLELEVSIERTQVLGEVAIVTSTSEGRLTLRSNGTVLEGQRFRETFVLQKVSGQWRIARYMYNTPQ